jgi:hypothetical protein
MLVHDLCDQLPDERLFAAVPTANLLVLECAGSITSDSPILVHGPRLSIPSADTLY